MNPQQACPQARAWARVFHGVFVVVISNKRKQERGRITMYFLRLLLGGSRKCSRISLFRIFSTP